MEPKIKAQMNLKAEVFKALAHPSRLFIVNDLAGGERCGCELTAMIGADKSTVSKHLSILKHAGIINDEKRGNMVFYSLRAPCVLQFISCIDRMISTRLQEMAEVQG